MSKPTQAINKFATKILEPLGFVQLNKSRTWILDKESYLVVICFDSSSHNTGSYVDIGIDFPWYPQGHITYDFFFGLSPRTVNFINFQTKEQFEKELDGKLEAILNVVNSYTKLSLDELGGFLNGGEQDIKNASWSVFHKAVIEGLLGRYGASISLFERLIAQDEVSDYTWMRKRAEKSKDYLSLLKKNPLAFQALIMEEVHKGKKSLGII